MKARFLVLAVTGAALVGSFAGASAKEHDFKGGRDIHGARHERNFGHQSHQGGYSKPSFLRGSYAFRDDDDLPRGAKFERERHRGSDRDRDRDHQDRHDGYRERHRERGDLFRLVESDPSPAFDHFWRGSWAFAGSLGRTAWWTTIAWGWDHERFRHWHKNHHQHPAPPSPTPSPGGGSGGGPGGGGPGSGPGGSGPGGGPGGWSGGGGGPPASYPSGPTGPVPIPEPSSLPLLMSGLLLVGWMFRPGRKRHSKPN